MFRDNEHGSVFIKYSGEIISGKHRKHFLFLAADMLFLVTLIPDLFLNFIYALPKVSEKAKERAQILVSLIYVGSIFGKY